MTKSTDASRQPMYPASKEDSEKLDRELAQYLLERHKQIKQERRALFTSLLGLSGGAIVLSMTMLNVLAPQKTGIWAIVTAWIFFALALLHSLYCMYRMTQLSMLYQEVLIDRYERGKWTEKPYIPGMLGAPRFTDEYFGGGPGCGEMGSGLLFVTGAIFLGVFAVINLLAP